MRLSEFLWPRPVLLAREVRTPAAVIGALLRPLAEQGALADPEGAARALLAREAAHATALAHGVAVPHAVVAGLERPVIVLGVAPEGTEFGPAEADPVRIFFLVLSPPEQAGVHIKLLARIARLARHAGFGARLLAAGEGVVGELERVDASHR